MTADGTMAYQRAADVLRRRIVSGELKVGDKLPGKADLARELKVAVGTAERAIRLLAGEGVLEVRYGVGTFVISAEPKPRRSLAERVAELEAWRRRHEGEHGG